MTYDEELENETFKSAPDIARRVFYTLRKRPDIQADRNSHLLGQLVAHLAAHGQISDAILDEMLFKATR